MPQVSTEKRKEYNRQYYLQNKEKIKCGHSLQKTRCKECGGGSICEHGRRKSRCKDCGGSEICKHIRRKSRCIECGGSQICEHNRQKSQCKDCDPILYKVVLQRRAINRIMNQTNIEKRNLLSNIWVVRRNISIIT